MVKLVALFFFGSCLFLSSSLALSVFLFLSAMLSKVSTNFCSHTILYITELFTFCAGLLVLQIIITIITRKCVFFFISFCCHGKSLVAMVTNQYGLVVGQGTLTRLCVELTDNFLALR